MHGIHLLQEDVARSSSEEKLSQAPESEEEGAIGGSQAEVVDEKNLDVGEESPEELEKSQEEEVKNVETSTKKPRYEQDLITGGGRGGGGGEAAFEGSNMMVGKIGVFCRNFTCSVLCCRHFSWELTKWSL